MPNLQTALRDRDAGYLRIVARQWGIEIEGADLPAMRASLSAGMLEPGLVQEIVAALPEDGARALADLVQHTGRIPWPRFTGQHGEFRSMGEKRRVREKPHQRPASAVELLYYRGLIASAFFESRAGPQEFAYIPDDLLPLIPRLEPASEAPLGRPAADQDRAHVLPANDRVLDHVTTLLAALRMGRGDVPGLPTGMQPFLIALLKSGGILGAGGEPDVEALRVFLELPRGEALARLAHEWVRSVSIDDLALMPGIAVEGAREAAPARVRGKILDFLAGLPAGEWWSLPAFIAAVKAQEPEFQRPDGSYESWYIREKQTGDYLRGFEHWDEVEGALIAWLVCGPLHWLGAGDLASVEPGSGLDPGAGRRPAAFRLSRWGRELLEGNVPPGFRAEDAHIHVRSDGRINVPRLVPRAARYLLARFCEWEPEVTDEYRYRATPSSLARAGDHGLRVGQLIALLARYGEGIPPNVTQALKNWERHGEAARIEGMLVLRLPSPEALKALRASRGARFLADVLGPAAVALKPGTEQRVLALLVELGYLGEIRRSAKLS